MSEEASAGKYPYLSERSRQFLACSDSERIEYIKTAKWIDYTVAKNILTELEELMNWPEDIRPPCRLFVGDSNNGKSSIIDRFMKRHGPDKNFGGDTMQIPVIAISALRSDEKSLYDWLATALFEPFDPKLNPADSQKLIISTLNRLKPKLIIVDEAHELAKGPNRNVIACQSALKAITNQARIPIAAFGTDEALNAFSLDDQMDNRFEPIFLPKWVWNGDFRGLLVAFESLLPLRNPSNLKQTTVGREILQRTGGLLGEVRKLLIDAATFAIKSGAEQITLTVIKNCKYRPVSERRTRPI